MRQGSLSGLDFIVIGDIRVQVTHTMFQLDRQSRLKLINPHLIPINAERIAALIASYGVNFRSGDIVIDPI